LAQVDILNLTLGTGQEVEQFWRYDLQPLLVAKFDHSLDEDEKDYDIFDLRVSLPPTHLHR